MSHPAQAPAPRLRDADAPALLAFSMSVLALEVLLTRLLAYSVHTVVLYAVLGIALLGFGAAGSLVANRPRWLEEATRPRALACSAIATALSVPLVHAAFLRMTPSLTQLGAISLLAAFLLMLPFLAAGTAITLVLTAAGPRTGRAYAANLVGSGLGCFIPLAALGTFSAPRLLGVLAVLTWASGAPWVWRARADRFGRVLLAAHATAGALALLALAFAPAFFPLLPEPPPLGQVSTIAEHARAHGIRMERRYDGSSATGRIEVFAFSGVAGHANPYPFMFYAQDSSAGSTLVRWDGRSRSARDPTGPRSEVDKLCTDTIYASAYFAPRESVLVVGLGGGPDLLCALYHEAAHVDVVEINPRTIEAMRGPFASFLGDAPNHPAVHMHLRDGRSFVRAAPPSRYDLIQLSGTDTKQNLASGTLTLAENHLYTVEAFEDYLRALTPRGALAIVRFGEAEALRLANTALHALERLGAKDPARHVVIAQNGLLQSVIVQASPLEPKDSSRVAAHLRPKTFDGVDVFFARLYELPFHEPVTLGYAPFLSGNPRLLGLFANTTKTARRDFVASYPFDLSPTTDDRPFFFDIFRHDDLGSWLSAPHMQLLRDLLASLALLSLVLVMFPVLRDRRPLARVGLWISAPYFACLGFGFLFIEVWLLSRFSMYLGHQTHGLSVVLSGLLVASGIGAHLTDRLPWTPRVRAQAAALALLALLLLCRSMLGPLTTSTLGQPIVLRVMVTLLVLLPLGLCMGVCMPSGLLHLQTHARDTLPLCIGINGFASVLATITVLPLSLYHGYPGVLATGAALYLLAGVLAGFRAWRAQHLASDQRA